ncbi:MAG TPA: Nudix family hydrolase [Casimicrobiaceae bacterium]|nr:Nudix family hydrolase [Casimicrobiaceae bacterium]
MSDIVRVAAAVIFSPQGQVLLAQRPAGKPYAGYWEFPGGKLEPGETPLHALSRELHEELGIVVREAAPWIVQEFVYPHAHVELHFFRVFAFDGEPHGHDGQAFAWQTPGAFDVAPLLPANTRVLAALNLPRVYGITCAIDVGEEIFLERADAAFANGLRLVQLREKEWSPDRIVRFSQRLLPIARKHDARVLLNGDESLARCLGLDGVHWTSEQLASAHLRPDDLIVGASCHDAAELQRAAQLGCDFAVLGPVQATPTHPNARLLGWQGFARIVESTHIPVYALGGMALADLHTARMSGAHGIAMRRGAW